VEGQAAVGRVLDLIDPGLCRAHLAGPGVVRCPQPIAAAGLCAQLGQRTLVGNPTAPNDGDPVADVLDLDQKMAGEQHRDPL